MNTTQVTRRMGWAQRTVHKKLYNSRAKIRRGEELGPLDIPLPDYPDPNNPEHNQRMGPQWLSSNFAVWAKRYERIRAREMPDDEEAS